MVNLYLKSFNLPFYGSNNFFQKWYLFAIVTDDRVFRIKTIKVSRKLKVKKLLKMTLDWYLPIGNYTKLVPNQQLRQQSSKLTTTMSELLI